MLPIATTTWPGLGWLVALAVGMAYACRPLHADVAGVVASAEGDRIALRLAARRLLELTDVDLSVRAAAAELLHTAAEGSGHRNGQHPV